MENRGKLQTCFSLGHRKHSAPRRGSLAFRPRARAGSFVPTVHTWPKISAGSPTLLGFPAVKVGTMHSITLDDREKTPNFGKPLFNPTSVLAVPETAIVGLRLYSRENGAEKAVKPKPLGPHPAREGCSGGPGVGFFLMKILPPG